MIPTATRAGATSPAACDPPSLHEDYLLGEVLGRGGMGVVYSAIQRALGRRVAIKVPHAELAGDAAVIRRFLTEARAGGRIDHPNVARVIDFGGGGTPFLVMEYVGGTPLDELVIEQGPIETRLAVGLCDQVLSALHGAHTAGVVHADIKSGNVLVETLADGVLLARVIDFGLARFCHEPSLHDGRMVSGTPDYLAPELIRGAQPTVASDIYAAGVVLYELLTGTTPFGGGSSEEILGRQVADVVVPPSLRWPDQGIPEALDDVVMCALAKDPRARFATAVRFADALRSAVPAAGAPPARIARGTRIPGYTAESTTRTWPHDGAPIRTDAEAATAAGKLRVHLLRKAVDAAIAGGDGDVIVASYLELVRARIDGRQLAAAAAELDRGLERLRRDEAIPLAIWRLQLCLAALYSGLNDPVRARSAATRGHADAVRVASVVGEDRANELVGRLARHGKVA